MKDKAKATRTWKLLLKTILHTPDLISNSFSELLSNKFLCMFHHEKTLQKVPGDFI